MSVAERALPDSEQAIGRFRILRPLGKGSQGIVYLAMDPHLQRQVAIKTLTRRRADPAVLVREARTVSRLSHPNIVPVYDMGEQQGVPYVVYEYVEGRSLKAVLAETGAPPARRALQWTGAILDALAYAHDQGIIHRDLNPANILIGADDIPRVMDFGIAAVLGTRTEASEGLWGTPNYLAPEMAAGGTLTPATDLFALGLILWEMLSGRPAVPASDPLAAIYRLAHEPIEAPSRVQPDVDPALDAIVLGALVKNPEGRYQSAREMQLALARYLEVPEAGQETRDAGATLAFLLRRMQRKSDFPALSHHISEVSQKLSSATRAHIGEVSNVILKDYALTTKLLKLVNSSFYGQYGGRISTVSRAIVVLGFQQVRSAALSLLLFEHLAGKPHAKALQENAGQAFLSGVIGRQLAETTRIADAEQSFVCAMFHNLGRYLTLYYFPEEYEAIGKAMAHRGLTEDAAARQVLGLSFDDLAIGVAREWHLPEEILRSMRPVPTTRSERDPDPRDALRDLSAYANGLTEILVNTPGERQEAQLQDLQRRFLKSVPVTRERLADVVDAALGDLKSYASSAKVDLLQSGRVVRGVTEFLQGARQGVTASVPADRAATAHAGAAVAAPADLAPEAESSQSTLLNGIQDITQALVSNYALNDILVMVLETIFRGMGFTRTLLCIRDLRSAHMTARFGLGQGIDTLIPRFRFPLRGGHDLFSRTVQETGDLICAAPLAAARNGELPDWYRRAGIEATTFALYPIVVNRVCLGLLYADREEPRPITGAESNYLNTLRNQAALAIKQSASG